MNVLTVTLPLAHWLKLQISCKLYCTIYHCLPVVFCQGNSIFQEHFSVKSYDQHLQSIIEIQSNLERCVFNSIKEHVFEQINPSQHGFVAGKSCVTQLVEVLDHIGSQLEQGKRIDLIYLDMSKAFDKVSHAHLIIRLRDFGFGGVCWTGLPCF